MENDALVSSIWLVTVVTAASSDTSAACANEKLKANKMTAKFSQRWNLFWKKDFGVRFNTAPASLQRACRSVSNRSRVSAANDWPLAASQTRLGKFSASRT